MAVEVRYNAIYSPLAHARRFVDSYTFADLFRSGFVVKCMHRKRGGLEATVEAKAANYF